MWDEAEGGRARGTRMEMSASGRNDSRQRGRERERKRESARVEKRQSALCAFAFSLPAAFEQVVYFVSSSRKFLFLVSLIPCSFRQNFSPVGNRTKQNTRETRGRSRRFPDPRQRCACLPCKGCSAGSLARPLKL